MNNGYSKIDTDSRSKTHKSRSSMDFSSDSFTFPQTITEEEPNQMKKTKTQNSSSSPEDHEGEKFDVIPGRSRSVSSSSTSGFVKRAFSVRRSSSVSERYCRIHDQHMALASPTRDDIICEGTRRSMKKKKQRGGNILKACKRLLGL